MCHITHMCVEVLVTRAVADMRFIKLQYRDFELFDISWTEVNLNYYSSHKEAYRQMWKEQVRDYRDTGKTKPIVVFIYNDYNIIIIIL